jgi:hypothetical protein
MPKFMTYQRPVPVNKQSWGGKPGHAYGPVRKPVKVEKTEQQPALPKLPVLPTRH